MKERGRHGRVFVILEGIVKKWRDSNDINIFDGKTHEEREQINYKSKYFNSPVSYRSRAVGTDTDYCRMLEINYKSQRLSDPP